MAGWARGKQQTAGQETEAVWEALLGHSQNLRFPLRETGCTWNSGGG